MTEEEKLLAALVYQRVAVSIQNAVSVKGLFN